MIDPVILFSALTLGFLGSGHCVAMCGGICSALSLALPQQSPWARFRLLMTYHVGRIFSYAVIGALLGGLTHLAMQSQLLWLRLASGIFLILAGLYLANWWLGLQKLEQGGQLIWKRVQPFTKHFLPADRWYKGVLLGALWGWLPCGLVYSALVLASAQAHAGYSALVMTVFGLGTLPALLVNSLFAERMAKWLQGASFRRLAGVSLMAFGGWTTYMALAHASHSGHHGGAHADHQHHTSHEAHTAHQESQVEDHGDHSNHHEVEEAPVMNRDNEDHQKHHQHHEHHHGHH